MRAAILQLLWTGTLGNSLSAGSGLRMAAANTEGCFGDSPSQGHRPKGQDAVALLYTGNGGRRKGKIPLGKLILGVWLQHIQKRSRSKLKFSCYDCLTVSFLLLSRWLVTKVVCKLMPAHLPASDLTVAWWVAGRGLGKKQPMLFEVFT